MMTQAKIAHDEQLCRKKDCTYFAFLDSLCECCKKKLPNDFKLPKDDSEVDN